MILNITLELNVSQCHNCLIKLQPFLYNYNVKVKRNEKVTHLSYSQANILKQTLAYEHLRFLKGITLLWKTFFF